MRDFLCSAVGILALVFSILSTVFTTVGLCLALLVTPQAIGFVFLCVGGGSLTAGLVLLSVRLATLRRRTRLLATGVESQGTIVEVVENRNVRVNGRSPWVVRYRYTVQFEEYHGRESMMDLPVEFRAGASVRLVYDPDYPSASALKRPELLGR